MPSLTLRAENYFSQFAFGHPVCSVWFLRAVIIGIFEEFIPLCSPGKKVAFGPPFIWHQAAKWNNRK